MTDTAPQPDQNASAATGEQTLRCLRDLTAVTDRSAHALELVAQELKLNRTHQEIEISQRIELANLKQDSAIVCELFTRQSDYLAHTIMKIEQRSGVDLSPTDLLAGIINGIQQSGLELSHCGTREDASDLISHLINLGLQDVGRRNNA